MNDNDVIDLLNDVLIDFSSTDSIFTVYDVVKEARKRSSFHIAHGKFKNKVHEILKNDFPHYTRQLRNVKGSDAFVYCPNFMDIDEEIDAYVNEINKDVNQVNLPTPIVPDGSPGFGLNAAQSLPNSNTSIKKPLDNRYRLWIPSNFLKNLGYNVGDEVPIYGNVFSIVIFENNKTHYTNNSLLAEYTVDKSNNIGIGYNVLHYFYNPSMVFEISLSKDKIEIKP